MKINKQLTSHSRINRVKEKFGIGKYQMFAIRKPSGELSYDRNKISNVTEDVKGELNNADIQPQLEERSKLTEILAVGKDEIIKALKSMTKGKAPGNDGISNDFIKEA